jgi:hypothetical protein
MAKKKLDEVKKINTDRLMSIENLKEPLLYDIPREYIRDMGEVFVLQKVIEELKKSKDNKFLHLLADRVAEKLFDLEEKYRDRTGEVINFVAEKTGIYFPHVLQRYVEYFYIGTRPEDRYDVAQSTLREIKINFNTCSFKKALIENNIDEGICSNFCRGVIEKIIQKLNLQVRFSIKQEKDTDYCEHQFFAKEEQ